MVLMIRGYVIKCNTLSLYCHLSSLNGLILKVNVLLFTDVHPKFSSIV